MKRLRILNLTPIKHIDGLEEFLSDYFEMASFENVRKDDEIRNRDQFSGIFTNPNMSKLRLDESFLANFKSLRVVATASTGLTHIDLNYLKKRDITLISLTTDYEFINQISSTAEHAFALTLEGIRNLKAANASVVSGHWKYLPHIGRQINKLTFGVMGYGRLGKMYSRYVNAFGGTVLAYDPYVKVSPNDNVVQLGSMEELFERSDVISLHAHVNSETTEFIDKNLLNKAKETLLLINTARGELIKESDLLEFLARNPRAKYSADVLTNETGNLTSNPIYSRSLNTSQIFITPHIGGMTKDAQNIAYFRTAQKLIEYFDNKV
jgi:D-3-phosphoglycerate dehydrogenase